MDVCFENNIKKIDSETSLISLYSIDSFSRSCDSLLEDNLNKNYDELINNKIKKNNELEFSQKSYLISKSCNNLFENYTNQNNILEKNRDISKSYDDKFFIDYDGEFFKNLNRKRRKRECNFRTNNISSPNMIDAINIIKKNTFYSFNKNRK